MYDRTVSGSNVVAAKLLVRTRKGEAYLSTAHGAAGSILTTDIRRYSCNVNMRLGEGRPISTTVRVGNEREHDVKIEFYDKNLWWPGVEGHLSHCVTSAV